MSILSIETFYIEDGYVNVIAVVEDMKLLYNQTIDDPPEYVPALCEASFEIDSESLDEVVSSDVLLIEYLESLDLDWEVVDTDDYDIGLTD
jgi:hypothetical protein